MMSENKDKAAPKKGKWLRRIVVMVFLLALLVGGAYLALSIMAGNRLAAARFDINPDPIEIPEGDDAIARGEYLANSVMLCTECHGKDLGGAMVIEDGMMANLAAPNLTSGTGGVTKEFTVSDWIKAIRYGVGHDGRALMVMPSDDYWSWSDEDIGAVIAYIQSRPAVDREFPKGPSLGPIGTMLIATNQMPLFAEDLTERGDRPEIPERGPTREYGKYLSSVCAGCHTTTFTGGVIPGGPPEWPPSANITPHETAGIGKWTKEDFVRAIREGKTPDGRSLDKLAMPWPGFSGMTDGDLTALWLFLRSVQPSDGSDGSPNADQ